LTKILKNTTGTSIHLPTAGVTLPASSSRTLAVEEFLLWGSVQVIAEITPHINSEAIIVNDGINDLTPFYGLLHLGYTDFAFNVRFLSDPERVNGFVSKTVQEAIEEAAGGLVVGLPPVTTVGAVTVVAYSLALSDNTTYMVDARIVARRTDVVGDTGIFQEVVKAKRESAGVAQLLSEFQAVATRDDVGMEAFWDVTGNTLQLKVTGVAGKTIKWQPKVEVDFVS